MCNEINQHQVLENNIVKRFIYWLWRVLPLPLRLRYLFLWIFNQKFLVGVDALIVNQDQEILLFDHSYRKDFPWGLPGGYLKRGEDPAGAAVREIKEESGLKVRIIKPLVVDGADDSPRIDIVFLGVLDGEMDFKPSHEVTDVQFFSPERLPNLIHRQQEIIQHYFRNGAV